MPGENVEVVKLHRIAVREFIKGRSIDELQKLKARAWPPWFCAHMVILYKLDSLSEWHPHAPQLKIQMPKVTTGPDPYSGWEVLVIRRKKKIRLVFRRRLNAMTTSDEDREVFMPRTRAFKRKRSDDSTSDEDYENFQEEVDSEEGDETEREEHTSTASDDEESEYFVPRRHSLKRNAPGCITNSYEHPLNNQEETSTCDEEMESFMTKIRDSKRIRMSFDKSASDEGLENQEETVRDEGSDSCLSVKRGLKRQRDESTCDTDKESVCDEDSESWMPKRHRLKRKAPKESIRFENNAAKRQKYDACHDHTYATKVKYLHVAGSNSKYFF